MTAHCCPSYPCPMCNPPHLEHLWNPPQMWPVAPSPYMVTAPQPHGCICPPTSEKTCQGMLCPRRNFGLSAGPVAT